MPEYPSGTVTFLFTDIERSTSRWEKDPAAARVMVERHFAILREVVARQGGVLYKTIGDATQSAFPTAAQGVGAALDAQRGFMAEPWPSPADRPQVRMALHAGEAEPRDGDYLAGSLNRLSRLLDTAHGEQVLLSHVVAGLVRGALPDGATLEPLGEYQLRDILQPEEIYQLRHPALRADFPPLNAPRDLPHNLPVQPTAFLGREREIDDVEALVMRPGVRLVTLTGPGGVGKTRLAQRVAAEVLESFPDGVYYVDLARQTDPDLVPAATAAVLGLREQPGQSLAVTIGEYLRERRVLLVFDNFEHVLGAATFVAELLIAAPQVSVLATSRASLNLLAEHEYPVRPLPVPDLRALPPLEALSQYDAIQLFLVRAQALRPGFALTAENAAAIAGICARLDGLPLALELAAARVKLMPPAVLLARLERRLPLLSGGARDLPARQRTLRDTIAWSHDLLLPAEQILFRRLSVFVGGWTLEGAEAVAAVEADGAGDAIDALQGLSSLIDQSLIDERPQPEPLTDDPRYRMLETIREFAGDQLAASGEADRVERAFEAFLVQRVEAAEAGLAGPEQPLWLDRLEAEHDNLRGALGRVLARGDEAVALRLAPRLWQFWRARGFPGEGRSWLERTLEAASEREIVGRAATEFALGKLSLDVGDYASAETHFQSAISMRRKLEDPRALAEALSSLAVVSVNLRHYDDARALGEEALQIFRARGDQRGTANALHDLGLVAREQGDYAHAIELFDDSMMLWRTLDDPGWMGWVSLALGVTHRLEETTTRAEMRLEEAHNLFQQSGDRFGLAVVATEKGHLAREAGNVHRAIELYGTAMRDFEAIGAVEGIVYCLECIGVSAAEINDPTLALQLFGTTTATRLTLHLPPHGDSDARMVAAGLNLARRAFVGNADSLLVAGNALTLEQAQAAARQFVARASGDTLAATRDDRNGVPFNSRGSSGPG